MSIFCLNAENDNTVIKKAHFQLSRWIDFLNTSKKVLQRQEQSFYLEKVWYLLEDSNEEEKKSVKKKEEYRYYFNPEDYNEKDARLLESELFGEGASWILDEKLKQVRIKRRDPNSLYLSLSWELKTQLSFPEKEDETRAQKEEREEKNENEREKFRQKQEQVRAKKEVSEFGVFGTVSMGKCRCSFKPNTYQIDMQIKALSSLRDRPLPGHQPLLRAFGRQDDAYWGREGSYHFVEKWSILDDESFDGVDEQRNFVRLALESPDFALLEGPPGSGKTTTIIELILQLVQLGQRVLLCSATHVAIDNVISRMLGKYKEKCEEFVIPVRIGSDPNMVDSAVRPYLLDRLVKTKKKQIREALKDQQEHPSQAYLYNNLDEDQENDIIAELILDSANLVAGTSIGLLKHPSFKNEYLSQKFDVLIVDEASKVTFQEFLVPALNAKKWVLVGDIKQLSPYVEGEYISANLSQMLQSEMEQAFWVETYKARQDHRRLNLKERVKVIFTRVPEELPIGWAPENSFVVQANDQVPEDKAAILEMNAADFLLLPPTQRAMKKALEYLYVPAEFYQWKVPNSPSANRQNYLHRIPVHKLRNRRSKDEFYPYEYHEKEKWADLLARNVEAEFGRRSDPRSYARAQRDTALLVPHNIQVKIAWVKKVAFPSILEVLQRGVGTNPFENATTVFSNGFSEEDSETRFTSLSFQHRMEEAIAQTSAKFFYEGNNLKTSSFIKTRTPFPYKKSEGAVIWIHNNDSTWRQRRPGKQGKGQRKPKSQIINPTEVEDIKIELKDIMMAVSKGELKGEIEVAILSFYKNQEALLRKMLRDFTRQKRAIRNFNIGDVKIQLCTVDKFQGQEADIVMLSFVKSSRGAFYHSPNRLNVALTRARYKLLLFGNRVWMEKSAQLEALISLGKEFQNRTTNRRVRS